MKKSSLILAPAIALFAFGAANAQTKDGHWTQGVGGPVWKNATGLCWKQTFWTPSMAIEECDPDLMVRPVAPPPPVKPAPAPAKPAPAPAKPAAKPTPPKPVVLRSTVLFATNKSALDELAKFRLDTDIVSKLNTVGAIKYVNVNGHTDRIGSAQLNQKLSERRAAAVKAYLVSKGMNAGQIETYGYGKTTPKNACPDQKDKRQLELCLAENRRVEVDLQGAPR
jgi:OOP family OmpA-OmpF porin